jgi:hypothetical protein
MTPVPRLYVGHAFTGLSIGLEVLDALRVRLWLHDLDLGIVKTLPSVDSACFEQSTPRSVRARSRLHEPSALSGRQQPRVDARPGVLAPLPRLVSCLTSYVLEYNKVISIRS